MQTVKEETTTIELAEYQVPIIARGQIIDDYSLSFGGRHGSATFTTPDPKKYLPKIVLKNPSHLKDLYDLSIEEILEFMEDLGQRCVLKENEYLRDAFLLNCEASGLTKSVLLTTYQALPIYVVSSYITSLFYLS